MNAPNNSSRFEPEKITEKSADKITALADAVRAARHIAVLTGAGISTESGIPDFRSPTGIYRTLTSEEIFDLTFFEDHPDQFYRTMAPVWKTIFSARPNRGHLALAAWEKLGKEITIATQNIDDLHRKAGSGTVLELHGSVRTMTCTACGRLYDSVRFHGELTAGEVPRCGCGGVLKPDITFFGEELPQGAFLGGEIAFESADLVLALGTSLGVYPAAGLPNRRGRNAPLIIVNRTSTPLDGEAAIVLHEPLGEVLSAVTPLLQL